MTKDTIKKLNEIASKIGYTGKVTEENSSELVKVFAEVYPSEFSDELHKITEQAAKFWEWANNSGVDDARYQAQIKTSESLYDMIDSIIVPLGMVTDRGVGLYPTYQVKIDGQEYTEYTPLNAMRRYNHFWG